MPSFFSKIRSKIGGKHKKTLSADAGKHETAPAPSGAHVEGQEQQFTIQPHPAVRTK